MSADEVDQYLRHLEEPKRSTLEALRASILEAEQAISYRVPAFRIRGKTVAGFAAFKDHLSYLPLSGSVLPQLGDELEGSTRTKSALHFPVDRALPPTLMEKAHRDASPGEPIAVGLTAKSPSPARFGLSTAPHVRPREPRRVPPAKAVVASSVPFKAGISRSRAGAQEWPELGKPQR